MTLSCNCDMPDEIYWDWLQDQGWDTDELREAECAVGDTTQYTFYWYDIMALGNGDRVHAEEVQRFAFVCSRGWGSDYGYGRTYLGDGYNDEGEGIN